MCQLKTQRGNKKIHGDEWKWKHNNPKSLGCSKSSSKKEVDSTTGLPQVQGKSQINNLTFHLKELEKKNKTQNQ